MQVKQIVLNAMEYLKLDKAAKQLSEEVENSYSKETEQDIKTLLFCYNAVEDEIARGYFPLVKKEKMTSRDGKFYFTAFENTPLKILRALSCGTDIKFKLYATHMQLECAEAEIEYSYAPDKKTLNSVSEFPAFGSSLIALGMAAEYCVINGEIEYAKFFESKYREEIERAIKKLPLSEFKTGYIPPRRWI